MKTTILSAVLTLAFSQVALADHGDVAAPVYELNDGVMTLVNGTANAVGDAASEIVSAVAGPLAVDCTLEATTFSAGPLNLPLDFAASKLGGNGTITCTGDGESVSHEVSVATYGSQFGVGPRKMKMRMVGLALSIDDALNQLLTVAANWKAGLSVLGLGGSIGAGVYVNTAPGIGVHVTTSTSAWFEAALGLEYVAVTDLVTGMNYGVEYTYDQNCKQVMGYQVDCHAFPRR